MNRPTSVYIAYDRGGRVIYVGITAAGPQRNGQHRQASEWWPYLDRQAVEHLSNRHQALKREAELIKLNRPPFNRQGNPGCDAIRAAYLAVLAAERALAAAQQDETPKIGCGHCDGCLHDSICYIAKPCSVCGAESCAYEAGAIDGRLEGWDVGFEVGLGSDPASPTVKAILAKADLP